ncbi:DUF4347 domain-containing protein [Roseomonas sp. GC11]|uniref:DUF4347 domain-containing protein n=1 Tax=Roseomonas sp. GC11 TaxID=2950546 RepID=UPI00210CA3E4|nr:DUF4347 domain-containing protein [Roseomonas sp. GC11]MCQ4160588.1 DUF4347 domain-containing protein [Roseomonas sp. GC11]
MPQNAAAPEPARATRLLVLDPRAPGWTLRLTAAGEGTAVLVLDPARDGLAQAAEVAAEMAPLQELTLCGLSEPGRLGLGSATLVVDGLANGLEDRGWMLAALGEGLAPGAALVLADGAGDGSAGGRLLAALARLVGRDVAAADGRILARPDRLREVPGWLLPPGQGSGPGSGPARLLAG